MSMQDDNPYLNTDIVFEVDHTYDTIEGAPKDIEVFHNQGIITFVRPTDEVG